VTGGSGPEVPASFAYFLSFFPDPTQTLVLDSQASRLLLRSTRQWGKSTIAAIKDLHCAINNHKATILIAAKKLSKSFLALIERAALSRRTPALRGQP
jgi:hypothetical protein